MPCMRFITALIGKFALGSIAFLLVLTAPAAAVVNCNSTVTFSSNTVLSDDYIQTSASSLPCITLTGGADLDLNGHTITRDVFGDYSSPAGVKCAGTNSEVTGPGTIRGTFYRGTMDCEVVDSITVATHLLSGFPYGPVIGISNSSLVAKADIITNNKIENHDAHGIEASMLQDTSVIRDNVIRAVHAIRVVGTGGSGPLIENNIIDAHGIAVTTIDYGAVRIRKNLIFDRGDTYYPCMSLTYGGTATDNICDCPDLCDVVPPFMLPWY
jgi:hypothetical protein